MPTTFCIPRRSPFQVLTEPDVSELLGADETRCVLRGMAVDVIRRKSTSVIPFYVRLFASERYLFISSRKLDW